MLGDLIVKHRSVLDAISRSLKRAGPGRPHRPEVFDDLIAAFALLVAVQHDSERAASYREVAEALFSGARNHASRRTRCETSSAM